MRVCVNVCVAAELPTYWSYVNIDILNVLDTHAHTYKALNFSFALCNFNYCLNLNTCMYVF